MLKLSAKISLAIVTLAALGFCVAFVLEELWDRSRTGDGRAVEGEQEAARRSESDAVELAESGPPARPEADAWRSSLLNSVEDEANFADQVLAESGAEGELLLEVALASMEMPALENHFVELMARDLESRHALDRAGRVLQEIARREPDLGVALLYSMTPAEKERLVPSLARGWVESEPKAALDWIASAWVGEDGEFIDRDLQNSLYFHAMDTLVSGLKDYDLAADILGGLSDPALRSELTKLVARRIVSDGPESALDRLANTSSAAFDASVMDAVAEQWAARDSLGAMEWAITNEQEMTSAGIRGIAKHLNLSDQEESLVAFHGGLNEVEKRDSVAAEVARLKARREPTVSAGWARAIEQPWQREQAVFDALYEIGYDSFSQSMDYIDFVYNPGAEGRETVVYATLRDWAEVDGDAVAGYLDSGRANLSSVLSDELMLAISEPD